MDQKPLPPNDQFPQPASYPPSGQLAPPAKEPRVPILSVLRLPAGGMIRVLWIGLMMMMVPFAIKHMLFTVTGTKVPSALRLVDLQASREAEMNELDSRLWEYDDRLQDIHEQMYGDGGDASSASREKFQEEVEQIQKQKAKASKELSDERDEISKKYRTKMRQARLDLAKSGASGLTMLRVSLWIKFLLDIPKVIGCFLILFASLRIIMDDQYSSHLKSFCIVCSTIVLLFTTVWSVLAYLS